MLPQIICEPVAIKKIVAIFTAKLFFEFICITIALKLLNTSLILFAAFMGFKTRQRHAYW